MYTHILVPLDGSETAERGLREAIKLAAGQGSRLRLFHLVDEYPLSVELASVHSFDDMMRHLQRCGAELLAKARRTAIDGNAEADTVLRIAGRSRVSERIADEAVAAGCDLIVMGTHGRRGISRLALGSTAEQVARDCPVPVLLVHGDGPSGHDVAAALRRSHGVEALLHGCA